MDFAPLTRIVLRYAIGYYVAKGILPEELGQMITDDPAILQMIDLAIAGAVGAVVEYWYKLAKKYGWTT